MKKYDLEFITEETNYGTNRNTQHFFKNGLGVSIVTAKDFDGNHLTKTDDTNEYELGILVGNATDYRFTGSPIEYSNIEDVYKLMEQLEQKQKYEQEDLGYVEVFEAPEKSPYPDEKVYGYGYNIAKIITEDFDIYNINIESREFDRDSETIDTLKKIFYTREEAEKFANDYVIGKYEATHKMTLDALTFDDLKQQVSNTFDNNEIDTPVEADSNLDWFNKDFEWVEICPVFDPPEYETINDEFVYGYEYNIAEYNDEFFVAVADIRFIEELDSFESNILEILPDKFDSIDDALNFGYEYVTNKFGDIYAEQKKLIENFEKQEEKGR